MDSLFALANVSTSSERGRAGGSLMSFLSITSLAGKKKNPLGHTIRSITAEADLSLTGSLLGLDSGLLTHGGKDNDV